MCFSHRLCSSSTGLQLSEWLKHTTVEDYRLQARVEVRIWTWAGLKERGCILSGQFVDLVSAVDTRPFSNVATRHPGLPPIVHTPRLHSVITP